jgi:hypothetical protein
MVPLRVTGDGFGSVPKIYVGSRDDRVLPWRFQLQLSKAAGAQFVELRGDHSPFLSVPTIWSLTCLKLIRTET